MVSEYRSFLLSAIFLADFFMILVAEGPAPPVQVKIKEQSKIVFNSIKRISYYNFWSCLWYEQASRFCWFIASFRLYNLVFSSLIQPFFILLQTILKELSLGKPFSIQRGARAGRKCFKGFHPFVWDQLWRVKVYFSALFPRRPGHRLRRALFGWGRQVSVGRLWLSSCKHSALMFVQTMRVSQAEKYTCEEARTKSEHDELSRSLKHVFFWGFRHQYWQWFFSPLPFRLLNHLLTYRTAHQISVKLASETKQSKNVGVLLVFLQRSDRLHTTAVLSRLFDHN